MEQLGLEQFDEVKSDKGFASFLYFI